MKLLSMVLILASGCASAADHPVPEAPVPIQAGSIAAVGEPAPDFVLPGTDGKLGRLSDHAGRVVVLEWFNPDCPFVEYAHDKGPLKSLPTTWSEKGVVWLPINSNAPGKQGAGMARNARSVTDWTLPEPVLWDSSGAVGRAYGATVTPQVFVVNAQGVLVYDGAVDNAPLGRLKGQEHQVWLAEALDEVTSDRPVSRPRSKAYGCTVKYDG